MRPATRRFHRLLIGVLLAAVAAAIIGSAAAAQTERVTVVFEPIGDSGVKGTATLTARGDKTVVELAVTGASGDHPDHIHRSTCANPEPTPTYPLSDVVLNRADALGRSKTTVDVPLEQLLSEPYLILIHKSKEEIDVYLACADITAASPLPGTGVGPGAGAGAPLLLAGLLSVAALTAARRVMGEMGDR